MLPDAVTELADRWSFVPIVELPEGYCCRAFADESRVLRWPQRGEEAVTGLDAALRMQEIGAPRVYKFDRESGAVLMERLTPGTKLKSVATPSDSGIDIAIDFYRRTRTLDPTGMMPLDVFYRADLPGVAELVSSTTEFVFLHGDLHQENIWLSDTVWRPIDPKGLVGDPHYEPIPFLRNLLDDFDSVPDFSEYLLHHVGRFGRELGLKCDRILEWLYLDARDWQMDYPPEDKRYGFAPLVMEAMRR